MSAYIAGSVDFLCEADRLKSVDRANVLMDLSRPENSAEHSWHVALFAMVFGASDRAIAMLLLHDLVEIDVGDQPIHLDHDVAELARTEALAAQRILGLSPEGDALLALWAEFEAASSADACVAKRMDHSQPLFQVLQAKTPLPAHLEIVRDNLDKGRAARLAQEWPEIMQAAHALMAGQEPADDDLARRLRFLAEVDQLKSVYRANTLIDGSRRENSAEHSWHLALYALALRGLADDGLDIGRVIRMLLLHDLVEIDVGDVPLHSAAGQAHGSVEIQAAEAEAARRIFGLLPERQGREFLTLWQEFEAVQTPEAIFAKSLDRCQPAIQNLRSGGLGWREYHVTFADVESRVGHKIALGAPAIWDWLRPQIAALLPA
ncbi:HD domain-containing protein [Paracoccus seriniphilus]|uniref:5'-deoxynucleotidase n=1 Tax=Paracoccus seriniphilus TaxID=184748 RepID=A0A239Q1C2_9RHOB|nr:HD domain-containing protein [Paracoccus seriniphilus]WCR14520.1 HD domain-containing protein [Paracoccus seriniphilus]SNT76361.1 putative hydrolases of HD superfamily [Paracoccus seriniphilus]